MQLQPTPRPEHVLRVSARLITSSTMLHLSAEELERAVNQEQLENPTFEVEEQRVCLFCGVRLYGQSCTNCGRFAQPVHSMSEMSNSLEIPVETGWSNTQQFYDADNFGFVEFDRDDEFDPLASIAAGETLAEILLRQLEALVAPGDEPIAEQLVGNLNEHGYLEIGVAEIAEYLQAPVGRVEYVLGQLHTLEPLGIGARSIQECLQIQLRALSEQETPPPLVYTLVDGYLEKLGRGQFHEIAREQKVSEQEVRQASHYIRSKFHPFPAHTYTEYAIFNSVGNDATYARPDVIIRKGEMEFEVELVEERRYRFRVSTDAIGSLSSSEITREEVKRYISLHTDRARFFIDCVRRRWRTLKRVAELVVEYQREFLERGVRYLRPLTRAEVATRLNLDEGTVSRATANKYALLPNGRLMPFSDFFDSSLGVKDVLRELILSEEPGRRFSDEELAKLMQVRGFAMARRTVTKYREEMGIGSSRER